MEQIRLIMLVESRIRGNVYVRFGGEFLKTSHSNMERRWELSLLRGEGENGQKFCDMVARQIEVYRKNRKHYGIY